MTPSYSRGGASGNLGTVHWVVSLELSAPYGGWRVRVDAVTGELASVEDSRLYRRVDDLVARRVEDRIAEWTGPSSDRKAAFAAFEQREAAHRAANAAAGLRATGSGVVFDPDPRTTLLNDGLQDGSPAGSFTAAYVTRALQDITFSGGLYRVTGPWVDIINWDPPATAPSTTVDGNWTAVRGNNAFNDAMTYFQIDQSQRYMQSLGFTGATGIQEGPIGTDTDGLNGADNSYYIPSTNRLGFGHGCVDDSEDADVMLHEYGHAINHDINPSWGGGDMGAIGEGWGDYWAGSYSFSTPNGATYHPEWIFSWDGHGTGNQCWAGRIMNATGAQYVHTTFYGAHQTISGGYQSDELWSTPCFQSLVTLAGMGRPREEVDTILLESQFGLGAGLKMRDMANAIIQTAQMLYPAGPHAQVLIDKFLVHNIIVVPAVNLEELDIALTQAGGNGAPDPGETVSFKLGVRNGGTLGATAVSATLTSGTPGVTVIQGASAYPDLPGGATGQNTTDFTLALAPSFDCGDPVALSLLVSYDDGDPGSASLAYSLPTGVPVGASASVSPELSIPDNNTTGVTSSIVVSGTGAVVTANFNVDIDITHTYIGDLLVTLRSPEGTTITLHNRTGGSADNLVGNYPGTLTPAQPLSTFLGQPLDGTWLLTVSDRASVDVGVLHMWGIHDVSGFDCDEYTGVVAIPGAVPSSFALSASSPNPFSASSSIRFAVPGAGADVRLLVFDVAGRHVRTLADGFVPAGEHVATWDGTDGSGRRTGSGIYFYRLESDGFRETRKVIFRN
jgi:subtilisin-like proprotein convertase family protein